MRRYKRYFGEITEMQAWILSYLTGLGPVGTEVYLYHKWIKEDLEDVDHSVVIWALRRLEKKGAIQKVAQGLRGSPARYIVLKRPEEFHITEMWMSRQKCFRYRENAHFYNSRRGRKAGTDMQMETALV